MSILRVNVFGFVKGDKTPVYIAADPLKEGEMFPTQSQDEAMDFKTVDAARNTIDIFEKMPPQNFKDLEKWTFCILQDPPVLLLETIPQLMREQALRLAEQALPAMIRMHQVPEVDLAERTTDLCIMVVNLIYKHTWE